ncbi:uncharacterized protein Dwil_GK19362 [Drosophila willistoni]|uniref:Uncharacterized protein n=1 Tax=Drosophila willistoni TaxID=7260 RepID=A0A0Q9X382_DROWI|nr:uncharacterized protein Dwil_GK19362 [Drosophila willistoni]
MSDLVRALVRTIYAYMRLLGLKNFEIDFNTGKTWTTRSGTIFAAVMNILKISSYN